MPIEPWRTIEGSQEIVYENPWYKVRRERFTFGKGKEGTYHVVLAPDSVIVIPFLPNGRIRLIRQYRYIFQREMLEIVSGSTKHGDDVDTPAEAAARELAEEAHLKGDLTKIGTFQPWNAVCSETVHVFIARDCVTDYAPADEMEEFEFVDLLPEEIDAKIVNDEITDGTAIAAWQMCKLKSV